MFYYFNVGGLGIAFLFYVKPAEMGHLIFHSAVHSDMLDKRQIELVAQIHIVFAERRGDMHNTRTGLGGNEISGVYLPSPPERLVVFSPPG